MFSIDNFNFEWFVPVQSGEQGHAISSTAEDSAVATSRVMFDSELTMMTEDMYVKFSTETLTELQGRLTVAQANAQWFLVGLCIVLLSRLKNCLVCCLMSNCPISVIL